MCCIVLSCDYVNKILINKVKGTDFMKLLVNSSGDEISSCLCRFLRVLIVILGSCII